AENSGESAAKETTETPQPAETAPAQPAEAPGKPEAGSEIDFGAILEQFEQEQTDYRNGDFVTGKIVEISERGVLIDFGYKSEGVVPSEEFTTPEGEMTVKKGDEVEVVIKNIVSTDAPPTLSYRDAQQRVAWDTAEKAFNEGTTVTGRITDKTKGGLKVDLNGVEAFLPGSQIDSRHVGNLDEYIGQDIEAKVIRFSRKRDNIVLSRKVITDEVINQQKAETLSQIDEGYIVEGTITNMTEYGAFVDLGGIDGLLHITDMSWGRINKPGEVFKPGDHVQVKVLKLNREKEKISLGYKQLIPDPWEAVDEIFAIGSRVKGKVTSVTEYGAFVELEPGVEGLVHVSEMSWSKRIKHPKNVVRKGDEIEVQILDVDPQERRISLGIKQLLPNPWDEFISTYQVGDKVRGQVRNVTDFGVFVEVQEGVEGLVHISDISWSRKIKHPKDVLHKGQEVDAVITKINNEARKISLSMKDLMPSAWETFVATHKPGDVVRGKISRFANFGVFVELADELEGLCHISELSDDRIEDPKKQFEMGQELDFKILRIEAHDQKIGLSHRAVGKEEEPVVDTKIYSTDAKGGMASLGELAKLKFGSRTEETKEEPQPEKAVAEEAVSEPAAETAAEETGSEVTAETASDETPTEETAEPATAEETTEAATAETGETAEAVTAESEATPEETQESVAEPTEAIAEEAGGGGEVSAEVEETEAAQATEESEESTAETAETETTAENTEQTEESETVDPAQETEAAPEVNEETAETGEETAATAETDSEAQAENTQEGEESADSQTEVTGETEGNIENADAVAGETGSENEPTGETAEQTEEKSANS
ncbi:MAG TPA: 30S ribosomal protein S1, partial [Pyrinomonadaceae bacterium]|nr:30S ribosomal protein S1 [Pyrinomonadaceae bacterium]